MKRPLLVLASALPALAFGCEADPGADRMAVARDTLPNGIVHVRYSSLAQVTAAPAIVDLRLGTVDGSDPNLSFADLRSVDAGSDGTIYVLDAQAVEVRAFDSEGRFLRNVATEGEGPGEISATNGMILAGDSILWVYDHGKWALIGLSPEGDEVGRFPVHVRSFGYVWAGTIDDAGLYWKTDATSNIEPGFEPEEGVLEGHFQRFIKSYDPQSEVIDTIYLGESSRRTHISRNARGGISYRGVPFDPLPTIIVDPAGGLWQANTDQYRIARLDGRGDTTLVIEADLAPLPVTAADRDAYVAAAVEADEGSRSAARAVAALMPETKPVIARLVMDDAGHLWVGRVLAADEAQIYDVFDRDGTYLGAVRLGFRHESWAPIRIRHGQIYGWELDELDIPFVVRAPVPDLVVPMESELIP